MTRHISLIISIIAISCSCCRNEEKKAIDRLESTIQEKEYFNQAFIERTDILKNQLALCSDADQRWEVANKLYKEYLSYDIDSAFVYSDKMTLLAQAPWQKTIAVGSQVSCLCALRMYPTAEKLLDAIDTTDFDDRQRKAYYNAHISLYTALSNEFGTDEIMARQNMKQRYIYQEKLHALPILTERERKYIRGKQMMLESRYDEALENLHEVLEMDDDISSMLHTTYAIANCYKAKGDKSSYKRWLAETAIYDIQRPNRQYRSLYDLALCLHEDGNYSKAGKFIHMTVVDAIACKHDTRIINGAAAQTIISSATEEDIRNKKWLWAFFTCIMMGAIVIISIFLAKVNRQRKRLKSLMKRTKELNIELSDKNSVISEANLIREKYMFRYMYLSANFVKEIDDYRRDLRHTYKEEGIEALMTKLREPEYMYLQYKAFYKLFDEIFLGIFPDFPEKVNSLLKEGKQINIKHKGTLPTELRILAVIRLGMTESRKIAEFLNTSVNTIYTYRTKMRYDSIEGPETFEESIKNIDYFKV